jgi:hypothetical protein
MSSIVPASTPPVVSQQSACTSLATGVSQSAFLRRVKGVESNHRVQSTTFKLGPDEVMHVECPRGSSHYLLLTSDDIDEQDHGIIHASADRMIVHVHNLANVEREFTIIWA